MAVGAGDHDRSMDTVTPGRPSASIVPASGDPHDQSYRFALPLLYLSMRERARLLLVRIDYQNGLRWTADDAADIPSSATPVQDEIDRPSAFLVDKWDDDDDIAA
jgi:hypothetical protein